MPASKLGTFFFVLDSDNLSDFCCQGSQLYGWCLCDGLLFENENLGERVPNGDGCYVWIRKVGDSLVVSQDSNGSYGLYLFQADGYFALSNSFQCLVEHVKHRYPLTLNRQYAEYLLTVSVCSASYSETLFTEIKMLDRRALLTIHTLSGKLSIDTVDYAENTVDIASDEGLHVLDTWYNKWSQIARSIADSSTNVSVDLSGGVDTRLTLTILLPLITSGSYVAVKSIDDDLHTHKEDFAIATQIANHYGFRLNDMTGLKYIARNLSLEEAVELEYALKLGFHKQMHYSTSRSISPRYSFNGSGGECVRSYWDMSESEYLNKQLDICRNYPQRIRESYEDSVRSVLMASIEETKSANLYKVSNLMSCLYRETRCRNHFGKDVARNYLLNTYALSPLMDQNLHRLTLSTEQCKDDNLLCAVILSRYFPDLISFPFEGGRSIDQETIRFARSINEARPYIPTCQEKREFVAPEICYAPPLTIDNEADARHVSKEEIEQVLHAACRSPRVESVFTHAFGCEQYDFALEKAETLTWHPLTYIHSVLAVCKALMDADSNIHPHTPNFTRWLLSCASEVNNDGRNGWRYVSLRRLQTIRVDIRSQNEEESIHCTASGYRTSIDMPGWMNKNGCGYTVEAMQSPFEVQVESKRETDLRISLRGIDLRNNCGKRLPMWVECSRLLIDGDPVPEAKGYFTHDRPFELKQHVLAGSILTIQIYWKPVEVLPQHLVLTDYQLREKALPGGTGPNRRELEKRLQELEHENRLLEGRLKALENSKAFRFGNAIAAPWRAVVDRLAKR